MNLKKINKKHKNSKILLLFMSRAIVHFILTISFLLFFSVVGKQAITYLTQTDLHPTIFSILFIFQALLNLNILLTVIYFIVGLISTCIHFLLPDIENQTGFMQILIFVFPFLMLIVLGPYVELLLRTLLFKFLGIL